MLHVLDLSGHHIKSFEPHTASITDISVDVNGEWFATASIDGQAVVHSLSTPESQTFNMKRSLRTVALEPNFTKSTTRSVVCGGMAGNLVLHEKGWLGYKETVLHTGEGPIWQVRWKGRLIAWANDLGVKIYDTNSQTRITFIDRPADSPRADLFKCTLHWQDDSTLLIAWADQIKVARIRARPRTATASSSANSPPYLVEITAVFQLDCMVAGIVPHPLSTSSAGAAGAAASHAAHAIVGATSSPTTTTIPSPSLTAFLVLAYTPPDTLLLTGNEATSDRAEQARKAAERPELRIVSRAGEELAADALGIAGFERWSCNDYVLVDIQEDQVAASPSGASRGRFYMVLSPQDIVVVKPRDWRDHVAWLVERKRYEEALDELEHQAAMGVTTGPVEEAIDAVHIGQRYIEHLISEGEFIKAARLCPKVCGQDTKRWEDWIFVFAQKHQLQAIIPFVPTESPTLGHLVYEMILAYFLANDRQALLQTIKSWPKDIYDIFAVIVAVQAELERAPSSSSMQTAAPESAILMECLAELYTINRQPGKALPYFLRLRRPNVFDLIREYNLFTAIQDQALLLVEFDQGLIDKRKQIGEEVDPENSTAIKLLVDHIHSIPIGRVVQQLQVRPYYLYLYLDALFHKDPHLTSDFGDSQVKLYAEYNPGHLMEFLRASNYYNLEKAYNICNDRDMVPEMVFLLGRMGNNKKALTLIIERLGDVSRAIDFAKEQHDDDLWEDLLKYSETRPTFIRGLLENVGAEIDPIRLIRRIKNGLEIPGLKGALIKILHDFNLQTSLLEGCQTIMDGDGAELARNLHRNQTSGFFLSAHTHCPVCSLPLQHQLHGLTLLFLCRHVVHASCVVDDASLAEQLDHSLVGMGIGGHQGISGRIAYTALARARIDKGCSVCHKKGEGQRL
ncbi:vacuolar protein sorting-associated protein 41 [Laetiporus sulphureus 93-53]|uniref:Vacuolar protein sorting-associated protein 41 n=1 Tax=Laetiporus sulphureus 93-53 TaxID=1314785 RepID=A0A165E9V4_9APHY|nr:vacuolar protein sorting-associated protein 41 [Laetiporus sulphureus 93-53]KZT06554.1 vacuolar protein sorting-associated protein 41 [Laetiporus sulphureus 93-53]